MKVERFEECPRCEDTTQHDVVLYTKDEGHLEFAHRDARCQRCGHKRNLTI